MDESEFEQHNMEMAATAAAAYYFLRYLNKKPRRSPAVHSATYMDEILRGHPNQFREICRMELSVFHEFCKIVREQGMLRDTLDIKIEEQLAMFLFTVGHNAGNRLVQKRFQHSGETISRHFNNVLNAIMELSSQFLQPPSSTTPRELLEQQQYNPFFKDCVGAIGSTHISASKGFISQHVMAACSFDQRFQFIVAGLDSSAIESTILQDAMNNKGFHIPEGKYYLVDAGYANMPGFLAPYQGVCNDVKEFWVGESALQNPKELFNYRHSSARNVIERIFGLLKARFPILKMMHSYPYETQIKVVIALCILHNYIRSESGSDIWLSEECESEMQSQYPQSGFELDLHSPEGASISIHQNAACVLRDAIANDMWEDRVNNPATYD